MEITGPALDGMLSAVFGEPGLAVALLDGGRELEGNGYERQDVSFARAADGAVSNDTELRFPRAEPTGYSVTGVAIYRDRLLAFSELQEPKEIAGGDWFFILPGDLVIALLD